MKIITISDAIGNRLMQKMGWRPGKGVGINNEKAKSSQLFLNFCFYSIILETET